MRILIVEDHALIGKALQKGLTEEAFAVDWVTNLNEGIHLSREYEYDTVILDLMLPDGSGLELLQGLRSQNQKTPVLILTAKDSLPDKKAGFASGADDYMAKPFAFEELLWRVRALTRRKYQFYGNCLEIGELKLDSVARTLTSSGQLISLTAKEFAVIELFFLRRGQVLSREKITQSIYQEDVEQESNVIDVFINKLRRKLEAAGQASLIETIRGEGYVVR
ncbi:MAG: response regulator transcription factor [Bdellovibrionales bacterium]|nr:response regulator transcription factor [Oligoflexia bacterium]